MLRRKCAHAVEHKTQLGIKRVLNPSGTVLIESRDAIFWRDVLGIFFLGGDLNKIDDRLLRRTIVPGRQWISASKLLDCVMHGTSRSRRRRIGGSRRCGCGGCGATRNDERQENCEN